jgi:hypothetical protein
MTDFTDINEDDLLAQISEMETWLIGCCHTLCDCGGGGLDPETHKDDCGYRTAAMKEVDGYVAFYLVDGLE